MGNSNISQHSKWRTVSPENSLLDLHEGHFSRPSEVPNALVCWDREMQRNTNGIWSPMSSGSRQSPAIRNKNSDPFDRNKMVGFFGDRGLTDKRKNGKKRIGKRVQEHTELKANLYVSDEIISSPTVGKCVFWLGGTPILVGGTTILASGYTPVLAWGTTILARE